MTTTRFAPSPSGLLHLGHAFSALFAQAQAKALGGRFLLRIEDIDITRCRPEFEDGIFEDLAWLGLEWDPKLVFRQSDCLARYDQFLHLLEESDLIYPCFCTRKEIQEEVANAPRAPHGPDGVLYPGICKQLSPEERQEKIEAGRPHALRIHMDRAAKLTGPLSFHDQELGRIAVLPQSCGDIVLARKDIRTSYHLSVTIDDALSQVNLITRGEDLLHATHVHRVLQALFGFPEPRYFHHPLLTDENGKRFAKRDKALTLKALREAGTDPSALRARLGFS
ncbi:tRNA glutamyl-Q(34) synthetase GluQRS [Aestuariispira insulae]|nr:tRNA glutamyl-Q(34) synthetase GluQRS [Aestuariispira insulae]